MDASDTWFQAARDGDIKTLKYVINRLRTRDDGGRTALMLYVGHGHSDDLSFFVSEISMVDNQGFPALKYAIDCGNVPAISYLREELRIPIVSGKTTITCEAYLRNRLTGSAAPYNPHEKRREHHPKQETSLMSESALELTRRSTTGNPDGSSTKPRPLLEKHEAVELDILHDLEYCSPKLSFYASLARQTESVVNTLLLNLPFFTCLEVFTQSQLEDVLSTRSGGSVPRMGLSSINRFKQAYLPLYDRYTKIRGAVPPDLYAQFIASLKPRVIANYKLFIAIFEAKRQPSDALESPIRASLHDEQWAAGLYGNAAPPFAHTENTRLQFNVPGTLPFGESILPSSAGTDVQSSDTGTVLLKAERPVQRAFDPALLEKILSEVENPLLGELLDCLTRAYTEDFAFVRKDLLFTQQLAKLKHTNSSEFEICRQKIQFYRTLYSKITTLYASIAGHPILPLFILNCNHLCSIVDCMQCSSSARDIVKGLFRTICTTFQKRGIYISQTDMYDEPLADPLYRPKMDCIAALIQDEERRISKLIDFLIELEALVSEYANVRLLMEKILMEKKESFIKSGPSEGVDRQTYESFQQRSQELRAMISSFWSTKASQYSKYVSTSGCPRSVRFD